jgi:acyl-phosphate glycerol 3-phosphate acyltransferase
MSAGRRGLEVAELLGSAAAVAVAYCIGSISGAYVIGRTVKGIDLTDAGDGKIGASLAMRRVGFWWGLLAGVIDFSKGIISAWLALALGLPLITVLLVGVAVVAGHIWSVFLKFKGGRGAATSFGVMAVFMFFPTVLATAVVLPFLYLTRHRLFFWGLRRTTVFYAILMAAAAALLLADVNTGFLPDAPWLSPSPLLFALLPPCFLVMNVAGGRRAG